MTKKKVFLLCLLIAIAALVSCSSEGGGSRGPNMAPDTEIVLGPDPGERESYLVELRWRGTDTDGRVVAFEYAWCTGYISCTEMDSLLTWYYTTRTDSTFAVPADDCGAGQCERAHTFCVRAVDDDGATDPEPAYVSFTATTNLPVSNIIDPGGDTQQEITQPSCVTFRWEGDDPDGEVVEYRYNLRLSGDGPPDPDDTLDTRWSGWFADTDTVLWLVPLVSGEPWNFYIQARDNALAAERTFQIGRNHIKVRIDTTLNSKPWVEICCYRGSCASKGSRIACRDSDNPSEMGNPVSVAAGDTVCFEADFREGEYATGVGGIAFVENSPDRPYYWSIPTEANKVYPGATEGFRVPQGTTTIYVWAKDDYCRYGSVNSARIVIKGQ
jgi:hypothetical protein